MSTLYFHMAIKLYFKGLVHPKSDISTFTHSQSILCVYDFLLLDEFNLS